MKLLGAVWSYLVWLAIVGLLLWGAYMHGYTVAAANWQAIHEAYKADQAARWAKMEQQLREDQQAHQDRIADIDRKHQEELQNEIASRDRIIADLRAGNIQLRQRFTCPAAGPGVSDLAPGTRSGDAAGAGGLQPEDAEFLVRLASEADRIARQLQACQAIVRSDRERQ